MEKNFVGAEMIELSHEHLASVSGGGADGGTDGGSAMDRFTVQTATASGQGCFPPTYTHDGGTTTVTVNCFTPKK